MRILSSSFNSRYFISFWMLLLMELVFCHTVLSQEKEHSFKITGDKFIDIAIMKMSVAYDSLSADHLYICHYDRNGQISDKSYYLFTGKRFNLLNMDIHNAKKELTLDGIQNIYTENEILESEKVYKNGILQQQTNYYRNGIKNIMFVGDDKSLNGEFKMWHPNGQLSFSGEYRDNLKDGIFESFDASGNLERKGTYRAGKLVEGVAVVQNLTYDSPEIPASYKGNDSILNKILIKKTANLAEVKEMDSSKQQMLDLKFTIDKLGKVRKVDITNSSNPLDVEIIQEVFGKQFMDFQPAQIEGVPVSSYYSKSFLLSNKGLQTCVDSLNKNGNDSNREDVYTIVEDMPEFPGGDEAIRQFLINTIRYPLAAAEANIQGKVFVNFIILEDGTVSDIAILRSVHPLLDAEATRIVKQMPKWKPGRQNGKQVKVSYTIPINFVLE